MSFEMLDIGLILGSPTLWVFEDGVARYPGAQYFYDHLKERDPKRTEGGNSTMLWMQHYLDEFFDGNKVRCAELFQRIDELGHIPTDLELKEILKPMGIVISTPDMPATQEDLMEVWRRLQGGKTSGPGPYPQQD